MWYNGGMVRKSPRIEGLLRKLSNTEWGVLEYGDLVAYRDIAGSCEELVSGARCRLSSEEMEYYGGLLERSAKAVTHFYFLPKSEKSAKVVRLLTAETSGEDRRNQIKLLEEYDEVCRDCFDILARRFYVDEWLVALEWNRRPEDCFYRPRRDSFMDLETIDGERVNLIQDMQDLIDGKLDILSCSLPQRCGKTRLSLMVLTLMAFKNLEKSIFSVGHSAGLVSSFYTELLTYFQDKKTYRVFEIFKGHNIASTSAEYYTIDLDKKKGLPNYMFRSIDGNITGSTEASLCMYSDDLIKDQTEVINKDIADKIWAKFNVLVLGRMKKGVPLLYVGTLWGDNCPLSRLINEYKNDGNERYRFRQFAWCNSKGESQFDYKYGVGFDTAHFKKLERTMKESDFPTWCATYMSKPIAREGRPFAKIKFYDSLPKESPDLVVGACDVATAKGGDKYSLPIGYVYNDTKSIYIEDVIYSNKGTDYTIPKTVEKVQMHNVDKVEFEEKEGAVGKEINYGVASKVEELLKKNNYRCNISCHNASGLAKKKERILAFNTDILGIESDFGYKVYFKSREKRVGDKEYNDFVECVLSWSADDSVQKRQEDDAIDSIAQLLAYCVSGRSKKPKLLNFKFR